MSSLATRVLQLDLRGQLPPRHAPGDFTTPVETNAPPVSSSAARLWGPKLTKSWQRTLPNDVNVTAIFLNSHARPERVPEPFSRRCRPAAGCGAGGQSAGSRPPRPWRRHRGAIDGIQRPYFLAVIVQSLQRRASPVWAVRPSLRQARSPQRAERVGNARRF